MNIQKIILSGNFSAVIALGNVVSIKTVIDSSVTVSVQFSPTGFGFSLRCYRKTHGCICWITFLNLEMISPNWLKPPWR